MVWAVQHLLLPESYGNSGGIRVIKTTAEMDALFGSPTIPPNARRRSLLKPEVLVVCEGIEALPDMFAFKETDLRFVHLPRSLKRIGGMFCYGAEMLQALNAPSGCCEIGNQFAVCCKALRSVDFTFSGSHLYIGHHFMNFCDNLERMRIRYLTGEGELILGDGFSAHCRSLTGLQVDARCDCYIGSAFAESCESLILLHIPSPLVVFPECFACQCPQLRAMMTTTRLGKTALLRHNNVPPAASTDDSCFDSKFSDAFIIEMVVDQGPASNNNCQSTDDEIIPLDALAVRWSSWSRPDVACLRDPGAAIAALLAWEKKGDDDASRKRAREE